MTSASRNYPPEWRARRDAEQAKLFAGCPLVRRGSGRGARGGDPAMRWTILGLHTARRECIVVDMTKHPGAPYLLLYTVFLLVWAVVVVLAMIQR